MIHLFDSVVRYSRKKSGKNLLGLMLVGLLRRWLPIIFSRTAAGFDDYIKAVFEAYELTFDG